MLESDFVWIMCCSLLGGVIGACMMAMAQNLERKWNLRMIEEYWNGDLTNLRARIATLEKKISTISVSKPVYNAQKAWKNKGKSQRL